MSHAPRPKQPTADCSAPDSYLYFESSGAGFRTENSRRGASHLALASRTGDVSIIYVFVRKGKGNRLVLPRRCGRGAQTKTTLFRFGPMFMVPFAGVRVSS